MNLKLLDLSGRYVILLVMLLIAGCSDPKIDPNAGTGEPDKHGDYAANEWIYKVMKSEYLWNTAITVKPNYNQNYEVFFNSLLNKPTSESFAKGEAHDGTISKTSYHSYSRVSRATASKAMTRSASGKNSFGFEFTLVAFSDETVCAVVLYVVPGSPADGKLTRNDFIGVVDGMQMTTSNYQRLYPTLLPSDVPKTIKITKFSPMPGNTSESKSLTLTTSTVDDNPVFRSMVIPLDGGSKRVGYVVYNGFDSGPEDADNKQYISSLKSAFRDLKAADVTHLVLDLRYNPGGYVHVATLLASMIVKQTLVGGTFAICEPNKSRESWGYKFMSENQMAQSTYGAGSGVHLGLTELYVIMSNSTASASELVINGLEGVGVKVHKIGLQTEGKNVGSEQYNNKYGGALSGGKFGSFQYTMQPITFHCQNANRESDYANGFAPDYNINEFYDLQPRKELGDVSEPLLNAALTHIRTGTYPAPQYAALFSYARETCEAVAVSSIDFKRTRGTIVLRDAESE